MKRKWIIIIISVLVVGAGAFFLLRGRGSNEQKYQTATVTRGDLEATVTSTGSIVAVGTVEVGTQVSGTVEEVFADFNDEVHRGQLLARLDTRVLQASVEDAQANLDRVEAQRIAALDQYNRNKPLYDKKYISAIEFNQYKSALDASVASVTSARVALQRARTNLGYAEVRSPTDGTVIQRTVEPGQTVAASLSAPILFTIANDLANMQIEATVDESDIGQIKEGQKVSFTVQSQADRTFNGTVKQIRLQPETVQNVVNYTVVIDTRNDDGVLLPGMTATVNFQVNSVTDVLVVPNAALRFQPSAEVLEQIKKAAAERGGDTSAARAGRDSSRAGRDTGAASGASKRSGAKATRSRIWTLDSNGTLRMIPVRVGLSDGQKTEISGPGVREGMVVVTSATLPQASSGASRTGTGLPLGGIGGGGGRPR